MWRYFCGFRMSPRRDELLGRAFDVVEQMLASADRNVQIWLRSASMRAESRLVEARAVVAGELCLPLNEVPGKTYTKGDLPTKGT